MSTAYFEELIVTSSWETAAVGVVTLDAAGKGAGQYTGKDLGRAMKLGLVSGTNGFVECASGDEIDGFLAAIEPFPVNGGMTLASIQREGRRAVKAGAAIAYGAYVMAGTAPAVGTTETLGVVITDTHTTTRASWRYIRNFTNSNPSAAAALNDVILIERI
jgi:hypothetical protein